MGVEKQPRLDTWDDFAGDFIKAEYIKTFPFSCAILGVTSEVEDGRNKLIVEIEYSARKWKWDLNKTNQNFIRSSGIPSPKALIGKKITVDKIKVRNPTTGSMVDSLIITKIE